MPVAGTYDCVTKTPMGDQTATFTVVPGEGDSFTGTMSGMLGSMDIKDGKVDGDKLTWKMDMTMPMPMTLDCEALISGDNLAGSVQAGPFGAMPLTGTRKG